MSRLWLIVSIASFGLIVIDVRRRRQKMPIMNWVWAITGLYAGPLGWMAYRRIGRKSSRAHIAGMRARLGKRATAERKRKLKAGPPTRTQVVVAVTHCGAGCALGDLIAEWWMFFMPLTWIGKLGTRLLWDFILAWSFGVVFQYFTIAPMRGLKLGAGLAAAIRADTLSIMAYEAGMFGWMGLTYAVFFSHPHLSADSAAYWFMMQIAMMIGFITAYPVNRLLLARGLKERMPAEPDAAQVLDSKRTA